MLILSVCTICICMCFPNLQCVELSRPPYRMALQTAIVATVEYLNSVQHLTGRSCLWYLLNHFLKNQEDSVYWIRSMCSSANKWCDEVSTNVLSDLNAALKPWIYYLKKGLHEGNERPCFPILLVYDSIDPFMPLTNPMNILCCCVVSVKPTVDLTGFLALSVYAWWRKTLTAVSFILSCVFIILPWAVISNSWVVNIKTHTRKLALALKPSMKLWFITGLYCIDCSWVSLINWWFESEISELSWGEGQTGLFLLAFHSLFKPTYLILPMV